MPGGSDCTTQVAPPSVLATSTGPDGAADVATVDPTAQHRLAVAHDTAWSACTGAGRLETARVPCHGAARVEEVDVGTPDGWVLDDARLQAAAVPRATTQTTRAVRRPRVRVEARVAGTAHPSLAGPVVAPAAAGTVRSPVIVPRTAVAAGDDGGVPSPSTVTTVPVPPAPHGVARRPGLRITP